MSIKGNIRLQFLHHSAETFSDRSAALDFLDRLATAITGNIGETLEGEPIAVKYIDDLGNTQVILAVGKEGEEGQGALGTKYHYIDTALLQENDDSISAATKVVTDDLAAEIIRASGAETTLRTNLNKEITDREDADSAIWTELNTIEIKRTDGTIVIERPSIAMASQGTKLSVNIDNATISTNNSALCTTLKIVSGTSTGVVRDIYNLVDKDGNSFGDTIKVYNDWNVCSAITAYPNSHVDTDGNWTYQSTGSYLSLYIEYVDEAKEHHAFETPLKFVRIDNVGSGLTMNGESIEIKLANGYDSGFVKLDSNGLQISGITEAFANEANLRSTADTALNNAITGETSRATTVENTLTTNLNKEITDRGDADTILQGKIDSEAATARNAEAKLTSGLTAEVTRATGEEARIEALVTAGGVSSSDGTITVTKATGGTDIVANIDWATITADTGGKMSTTLQISAITPTDTNVREEFVLVDGTTAIHGPHVKIYKDSSLESVELSGDTEAKGQWLIFTYILEDGTKKVVPLDVSKFLVQAEFKDGLEVTTAGTVNVKVNSASEYLGVNSDGVWCSGINAAIMVETDRATAAENVLTKSISDEVIRATGAEQTLTSGLTVEVTRATGAEQTLTTNLAAEVIRATGAEQTLTSGLTVEETNRTTADTALGTRIDNEEARAQGVEDTLNIAITNEATAARAAEYNLQANITAEETRAKSAEQALTSADTTLNNAITGETARATAAENYISGQTNNVLASANTLSGAINTLRTDATTSATTLQKNITAEETRAKAAENSISASTTGLSAQVQTLSSACHTLNTNLYDTTGNTDSIRGILVTTLDCTTGASLLRIDSTDRVYASVNDTDMYHGTERLYTVIEALTATVVSLSTQVTTLENFINNTTGLNQTIKNTIASTVIGTGSEIKVTNNTGTEGTNTVQIGFADNAVFGATTP